MSSIISDLKNFSGKIVAKHISTCEPSNDSYPQQSMLTSTSGTTTETHESILAEIITKIPKELTPMTDKQGYIYDLSTIACECSNAHVHKYFLRDVGDKMKCLTCSHPNKFMQRVRKILDDEVSKPFTFVSAGAGNGAAVGAILLSHPCLPLRVLCDRVAGTDSSALTEGIVCIHLHTTISNAKIRNSLIEHLSKFIEPAGPLNKNIIAMLQPAPVKRSKPVYRKNQLPYAPELAKIIGSESNTKGTSYLCIENC